MKRVPGTCILSALLVCAAPLFAAPVATTETLPAARQVSVSDHGAVGDGETDNTAAFRAAILAVPKNGGTLKVPPGDYKISSTLDVRRGDISIECDANARWIVAGRDVILLRFLGLETPGGRINNVRVVGCEFVDPDPAAHVGIEESHGIVLWNVDYATLRDLKFDGIGDESVDIISSNNVKLVDSFSRNGCSAVQLSHVGAFSVNNSSNVQIRGNTIENNLNGSAIRVEITVPGSSANHILISDNQVFGSRDSGRLGRPGGSGIAVITAGGHARGITIANNQIYDPFRAGIVIDPLQSSARGFVISGNLIAGGGEGAHLDSTADRGAIHIFKNATLGSVVGNVIQDWGGTPNPGIVVVGDGFSVFGNAVGRTTRKPD